MKRIMWMKQNKNIRNVYIYIGYSVKYVFQDEKVSVRDTVTGCLDWNIWNFSFAVVCICIRTSLSRRWLSVCLESRGCIWNALYVYTHPLRRFAATLLRMFIFPGGSFQSFCIKEYLLLYYLYRKSVLRLPYHSFVRDMAAIPRTSIWNCSFSTENALLFKTV